MKSALNLLALPLVLSIAGGQAAAAERSGGLSCEIRAIAGSGAVTLQAVALSLRSASGEYEFEVKKSGGGGTSNSAQAGDFEVIADGEAILSEITIAGGGSVEAHLTVWSATGDVVCEAEHAGEV